MLRSYALGTGKASAVAAFLLTAPIASATPLLFSYTDPGVTMSFVLDSNPTPISATFDSFTATVTDMTVDGSATSGAAQVSFSDGGSGGLQVIGYDLAGVALFTGGTGAAGPFGTQPSPTFSAGSFKLADIATNEKGELTISAVSAAPEPSSWALMFAGVATAGAALRRRRATRPAA